MNAPQLRWGVIGVGSIAEQFVPDLRHAAQRVSALASRRPGPARVFAARHEVDVVAGSVDELLARDDVDIVYIATPPASHAELALRALDHGKHVLVEKPMSMSAHDNARIFERAASANRFVAEAMWMKFNPLHREVMRRVHNGVIGTPGYVRAGFGVPFPAGGNRWLAEQGGSNVLDQGIYPITLAQWALGPVAKVVARGQVRDAVDVSAEITLHHRDGGVAHLASSMISFIDPSASLSGSRGWYEIPAMFWGSDLALEHAGSEESLFRSPERVHSPRVGQGYAPMISAVADAVAKGLGQHPWHDATATLETARILDDVRAQILGEGRPRESQLSR